MPTASKRATTTAGLLALTLLAAGCGGDGGGGADGGVPEFVSIATGGTGGAYYPIGGAMGSMLAREIEDVRSATAETTGGSVENLQLVAAADAEIGMAQNDAVFNAVNGEGAFDAPQPVCTIALMYLNVLQVVTVEGRGISTFMDLPGKRVSVGDAGSATELFMRQVTEALGMSYDDFGQVQRLPFADQTTAIRNNQLDVGSWVVAPGASSIQDLASSEQIVVLPLDEQQMSTLTEQYPYYVATELEPGTYQGQDEAVPVAATWNSLLMNAEAGEDFVYEVTKAVHENVEDLAGGHPSGGELAVENIGDAIAPLHPGAARYFDEVGQDYPDDLGECGAA
jgi:uncharacterized protein